MDRMRLLSFLRSEWVGNLFETIDWIKDCDRRSSKDDQTELTDVRFRHWNSTMNSRTEGEKPFLPWRSSVTSSNTRLSN